MYFPFLRGKQYELIALRELKNHLNWNYVIPIVEPVKKNLSGLFKVIETQNIPEQGIVIIINPEVGDWKSSASHETLLDNLEKNKRICPLMKSLPPIYYGIIMDEKMQKKDLEHYLSITGDKKIGFIHKGLRDSKLIIECSLKYSDKIAFNIFYEKSCSKLYKKKFKNADAKRILIDNNFQVMKNADYPEDEYLSDLHATFEESGMDGFGDYQIVGDQYSETGGPAYAVAIHITYINSDEELWVKHFISDDTETNQDPGRKFLQALTKLIKYIDKNPEEIFRSTAITEFYRLHKDQHFPGLGVVKKLSIKHHIELMANYLGTAD